MDKTGSETSEGVARRSMLAAGVAATTAGMLAVSAVAQEKEDIDIERGSEKLMAGIGTGGHTFSVEELRQVIGVFRKHRVRVIDWCQYGQPAVDGACGTVVARPGVAGSVLSDLLTLNHATSWRTWVFPYGIPVLDRVVIRVQAGVMGGGVIVNG